jgi:hypothetical protein
LEECFSLAALLRLGDEETHWKAERAKVYGWNSILPALALSLALY